MLKPLTGLFYFKTVFVYKNLGVLPVTAIAFTSVEIFYVLEPM